MRKTHSPYAPEYRRQMVELVRSGRTPGELAREFECSASVIRNWVRPGDRLGAGEVFGLVRANQACHRVATMCRVLGVSPSGYYAWRSRGRSPRARCDEELRGMIRTLHEASRGTYGAPRMHAGLMAGGCRVGRKRVARLMRESGLAGVSRRRGTRTTHLDPGHRAAPDRVRVFGHRARRVQPPGGGMVDGLPSSYRTGARGAEHGVGTTPARRGRASFGPGNAVHPTHR